MGLDFSHADVRWSYSGFHHFRTKLASSLGFDLTEMNGFGGVRSWSEIDDPIVPFLNHSDCEGELTPEECKAVFPRIREIVGGWIDEDYDKQKALILADAMEHCYEINEALEFC